MQTTVTLRQFKRRAQTTIIGLGLLALGFSGAVARAGERAAGSVMASDAYFPFPDNIEVAAAAGVRAVVAPGGSRRDPEVIAAADAANLTLLFTSARHFRH